jgi:hypothetical protein
VLVEDARTFTTKPGQWADSRTISLARNLPAGSYTLDVRLFLKGRVLRLNSDFDAS